jgi:hypothetical protein
MNLLIIGIAATAGYFALKGSMNLKTFNEALSYSWVIKNFRFYTWKEIRFEIELKVLNPSDISITVNNPLIQILYEGTELTHSTYNIPSISVNANSETKLPRIEFKIDLLSNWFTIQKMFKVLFKGVTFSNLSNAQQILKNNEAAFLKLLDIRFTGRINGNVFTKTYNLA